MSFSFKTLKTLHKNMTEETKQKKKNVKMMRKMPYISVEFSHVVQPGHTLASVVCRSSSISLDSVKSNSSARFHFFLFHSPSVTFYSNIFIHTEDFQFVCRYRLIWKAFVKLSFPYEIMAALHRVSSRFSGKFFYNCFWYVHTTQLTDASVKLTTMSRTVTRWQFRIAECMGQTIHRRIHWNFVNFSFFSKTIPQCSAAKSNRDTRLRQRWQ